MSLCNHTQREIFFKFCYFGPQGSGKSTILDHFCRKLDRHHRSELVVTENTESLRIDSGQMHGYRTQLDLVAVDSDTPDISDLLSGTDGIIFVADSTPDQLIENIEAQQIMRQTLEQLGYDPDALPCVYQFNKRDLHHAIAPHQLDEALGIKSGTILTCGLSGYEVFAGLDQLTQIVLKNFCSRAVIDRATHTTKEDGQTSSSDVALSR